MAFKVDNTAIYNTPGGDLQGFSRVMTRPTARVRGVSKCRGSGRVGSGHYVLKSHGSGRVGSRSFESRGSVWVGSRGFKISRVGSGRVGSGRGGSGRVKGFGNLAGRHDREIRVIHGSSHHDPRVAFC